VASRKTTRSPALVGSERKLAKRLVSPDLVCPDHWNGPDWILTDGPAVAELCAASGFEPDPQQALGLDMIFGVGPDGLPSSFSFCVICCRQNLKTGLFKQAVIGWLYVTEERRIVWSAHEMSTTLDAQTELAALMLGAPALRRRMLKQKNDGVYADNGSERIELATGQQVKFKARTKSGGRGLSGDKTILDEAFALRPAHIGSLIPTMGARPHGQVLYGSSAGMVDSTILFDVRDRGRNGTSPRLSYLEWLAEREVCTDDQGNPNPHCTHPKDATQRGMDCALDREHLMRKANPTISTGRMSLQTIKDFRQELPPEEFMRECLGWWDDASAGAAATFGPGRWASCKVDLEEIPTPPAAIGIAVSVDRLWASIASASMVDPLDPDDEDSPERVAVAAVDRREEVGWLVAEAKRIQDEYDCLVVADRGGPTGDLEKALDDAEVAVEWIELREVAEATSSLFDRVRAGTVMHPGSDELDAAVNAADWRFVSDRRVWGRRSSAGDISMLEAATLAAHGAEVLGAFTIH
jgi:hypothetical protein